MKPFIFVALFFLSIFLLLILYLIILNTIRYLYIFYKVANKKYSTKAAFKFVIKSYQQEGFFALWRGNSATMARIMPYAAVQFTSHEQWKRILHVDTGVTKKK